MDRTNPSLVTGRPSSRSISVLRRPPFDFVSVFNENPKNITTQWISGSQFRFQATNLLCETQKSKKLKIASFGIFSE